MNKESFEDANSTLEVQYGMNDGLERTKLRSRLEKDTKIYSRRKIEHLISLGKHVFIMDSYVHVADAWLPYHPGGDIAIKHLIGRDATDEVKALHSEYALGLMTRFRIGRVEPDWINFLPPIQGGKFRSIEQHTWEESKHEVPEISSQHSSTASSSEEPSPMFDPFGSDSNHLRQRNRPHSESLSRSSLSSVSDLDLSIPCTSKEAKDSEVWTNKEIDFDLAKYPSVDYSTQASIVNQYRLLKQKMEAEGLYDCNYWAYFRECCRYMLLFSIFIGFLHLGWYAISGLFLGFLWQQLVFSAHDAGHMGITHHFHVDTLIGIVIADFIGGLSLGWWKKNHNVHHIVTNSPEHDPDIEHMPFFAISHRFFKSLRSTYYDRVMKYDAFARFMIRYQSYLYYPVLLFGRFNLYILSWQFLLQGQGPRKGLARWHRWVEIAGHLFFWYWFGYQVVYKRIPTGWDRFAFVMVSHMVTAPLHVQITLSHFAMSTSDLGVTESFPQKMLRTTMDVDCPEWLDFMHGGLQFQAIHHLFPRMPRHNLRRAQKLVQGFCNDVGIPYAIYGFVDGNKEVIGRLGEVGKQAAILAACQKAIMEQPGFDIH